MAQTKVEFVLTMRRGESLLLTLGIPVMLLTFFSLVDVLPTGTTESVDFLAPGVLALAVMSSSMVGLSIATGFERSYGVLKRLAATPLGRPALLAAKTITVVAIELVQAALLLVLSLVLGWSPGAGWIAAIAAIVLGTVAFSGIGLAMAGSLRGEVNLAAANGLYLILLLLGGMIIPLTKLPAALRSFAQALPSGALSDALHGSLGATGTVPGRAWVVLVAWAVVGPLLAARTFRWE
jgi:ABC-2 type transport system permease protein